MRFWFLFAVFLTAAFPAFAQPAPEQQPPAVTGGLPERIIRPMRATGPMTLKAEGVNIRLWGIRPAETTQTPLELKALDLMDMLIHEQQVNCRITGGAFPELVARCATQGNQDLALELLANGYVVVDRQQTFNSVFATSYEKAQEAARLKAKGVWRYVNEADPEASSAPKWMKAYMDWLLPLALVFGPFGGLLAVALVTRAGLQRISSRQEDATEQARRQDAALQLRERNILASTLEGEISENKNKVEAFLAIYGDLLSGLKNAVETPKYQQAGDIVQKHPAFSRTVFEANAGKLSLLSIKTAGSVSKLYSALPSAPEYINLEPSVPLETAVKLIEKILAEAKVVIAPIDQVLVELQAVLAQKE